MSTCGEQDGLLLLLLPVLLCLSLGSIKDLDPSWGENMLHNSFCNSSVGTFFHRVMFATIFVLYFLDPNTSSQK